LLGNPVVFLQLLNAIGRLWRVSLDCSLVALSAVGKTATVKIRRDDSCFSVDYYYRNKFPCDYESGDILTY
jgi:hypothetical protein